MLKAQMFDESVEKGVNAIVDHEFIMRSFGLTVAQCRVGQARSE